MNRAAMRGLQLSPQKLRALDSERLRFLHDIGKVGLEVWSGTPAEMAQVRDAVSKLGDELKRRAS